MVPRAGVEPARPCGHRFLRPTRLPVPPPRRAPDCHSAGPRPYHSSVRIALAAALLAILAACGPQLTPSAAVSPGAGQSTAAIASGPRISQPPVTPPTPPGTNVPAFACADASGGKTGVANTITARVGEQGGYDRFVLQFDAIVPTYTVKRQAKPVFQMGASGQTVTLTGSSGVLITAQSATGATTFTGSTDIIHPDYQAVKEARQTQDFEGVVSWALGLSKPACMRAFTLDHPARLVLDFRIATRQLSPAMAIQPPPPPPPAP